MHRLTLLAAVLLALPAAAQPALFAPADGARASLTAQQATLLGHLERLPAATESRLVEARLDGLEAPAVRFNLLPGVEAVLTRGRMERRLGDGASYFFESADDGTFAILVLRQGQLTGSVRIKGQLYTVRPLTDGLHAVVRLNERRFVDHGPEWEAVEAEAARRWAEDDPLADLPDVPEDGGATRQYVLVPYTPTAESQVGDILALVQLAVDETNQGYANSDVDHRLVLAHTYRTTHDDSGDYYTDLARLANPGDGYFDEVPGLRAQYGADLVQMILGTDDFLCGTAFTILADGPDEGFAVCAQSCATGYYTFGHELGHLQGARHNPESDPTPTPFPYGHGKYSVAGGWRTVMGLACPGNCTRVLHWSNPAVLYNGEPTGDVTTRHNQRVLNETATAIATFFPEPALGTASVTITLTGSSTIGADGGRLDFDVTLSNASGATFSGEVWLMATLPNGHPYGPVFGPAALTLADGQAVTRSLGAYVPAGAPAGTYAVTLSAGTYPGDVDDSDSFAFTKSAAARPGGVPAEILAWTVEDVTDSRSTSAPAARFAGQAGGFALSGAHPNPFRGQGRIHYTLAEGAEVRLAVYDVLGREVAVLVEGVVEAGSHEVAFEGEPLPGGVYLYRLEAGGQVRTGRMTLLE